MQGRLVWELWMGVGCPEPGSDRQLPMGRRGLSPLRLPVPPSGPGAFKRPRLDIPLAAGTGDRDLAHNGVAAKKRGGQPLGPRGVSTRLWRRGI